ncbi:MAG: amino acid permease [Gemmatimonadetes bacterium]|nr:amino acid permease [Gemmatimonadota bacterium]
MLETPANGSRPRASPRTAPPPKTRVTTGRPGGLGTFGGVFTPSLLTILGVIMYLRFGWVVGNVGLLGTLVIVTLSTLITFLTALSIAAIATDQRVRTGGAYYMISRSLGIETGGAVGIPLFLAQALSVALYTVGFAESVVGAFPGADARTVGVITTIAVALLALISARVAIRSQYIIMGAIALSLISLVLGSPLDPASAGAVNVGRGGGTGPLGPEAIEAARQPFWVVFAVFFPAVTGIMAGVNMSGDLAEPNKSIPRGTFAAIGVGYLIYMGLPLLLAARADEASLLLDPLVMRRISLWGDAILLGVWGATLSSAVGSILGAPRVLQALARDGVLPRRLRWLGKGSGADDTPRAGTIVTLVLALGAVWVGDLNLIAPVLTMFFLTTYGVLNVAAGVERFLGSPSFRPQFQVPWALSLLGAVGCIAVMLLINPLATGAAAVVVGGVFIWLERQGLEATFGDVRRGVWMSLTRTGLLRIRSDSDPRNWRPHFLVLSGAPTRRWPLIELADAFTQSRGLLTVATVVPLDAVSAQRREAQEQSIREYLGKRGVQGLVRVVPAPDPFAGAERLVEYYGLGALSPNTVLLGDTARTELRDRYCTMIERFHEARRNIVIVRDAEDRGFGDRQRVDIWWGGLQGNGALLLILGYLLSSSLAWRGADVRMITVVPNEEAKESTLRHLHEVVAATRTGVRPVVEVSHGRSFDQVLHEVSRDSDLVLMGLQAPETRGDVDYRSYIETMRERTSDLPTTLFVLAGEEIVFREVLLRGE